MPRPRTQSREQLVDSAMAVFWKSGYFATSMEDLVAATGVSRGGIYTDFGGKDALFLASLKAYRERFAAPAIAILRGDGTVPDGNLNKSSVRDQHKVMRSRTKDESDSPAPLELKPSGIDAVEAYFDYFIELHRFNGMPGPGCFYGNVMVELESHQTEIRQAIRDHMQDLREGFLVVLKEEQREVGSDFSASELESLAEFLATASQGLWSRARSLTDLADLISYKNTVLALLRNYFRSSEAN